MENKNPSVTVWTNPFILSYPTLLKAVPYKENGVEKGEPVYSFEAIATPESLKSWKIMKKDGSGVEAGEVERRLVDLAKEKWGADFNVAEAVKHGGLKWPFKSGTLKAQEGEKFKHYDGKKFFRGKALAVIKGTPYAPALHINRGEIMGAEFDTILRSSEEGKQQIADYFYGGAICSAELNAVAGTTGDNKYVTMYINSVVFEAHGDRLGGGSNVERLKGIRGGSTPYDPTGGMKPEVAEDEIPF